MSSSVLHRPHRPPPSYRAARWLRRGSLIALVALAVFLATVGYSAFQLVEAAPHSSGSYAAGFASNGTVSITGSFELQNPGMYPLSEMVLGLRVQNASSVLLGTVTAGPVTIASQATTVFPIQLYLPISATGPAASLLVADQYLTVGFWANATYAYLFPISVHYDQNRSWGAPFANFQARAGTPFTANGSVNVPVTISFTNHATFSEVGNLELVVRASDGTACGGATFPLNVPPGTFYYQTENVALSPGCSVAGGSVTATYVGAGSTFPLPPEPLP